MLTLNNVVTNLNNIADAHSLINNFFYGEIYDFSSSGTVNYPAMLVTSEPNSLSRGVITMSFNIYIADLVQKGIADRREVSSNTQQTVLDILATLDRTVAYDWNVNIDNIALNDFVDKFQDEVTGWWFKLDLRIPNALNRCAVPLDSTIVVKNEAPTGDGTEKGHAFFTATGITDETIKGAVNVLISELTSYGIYDKLDVLYPMVGDTALEHSYNLVNPDNNQLTFFGGWTHASTGATPNGTTGYATTSYIPANSSSLTSAHLSAYQRSISVAGTSRAVMGVDDGGSVINGFGLGMFVTGTKQVGILSGADNNDYAPSEASPAINGFSAITVNGDRDAQHYVNGSSNGSAVTQTGSLTSNEVYIGATNRDSTSVVNYFDKELAIITIGSGLSATDITNLYNTIQVFQTTLSRNV